MRVRVLARTVAVVAVVGIIGAACGGNNETPKAGGSASAGGATPGGTATLGAEQWPQCLNVITSCTTATWTHVTALQPTLPKLMMVDAKGNTAASPVITEAPSLDNGQITQSPFSVTYHIDPKAVWDDGTPMTSADIDFTWKAYLNTTGTVQTAGYDLIDSIDTTDPATVKITFTQIYVDWYDLFGGALTGSYFLKKAAFPNADPDKPDLKDEMNDIIPFSGGLWKMQSWSKSQEVLVRNDKYWGQKTLLDQVTFIPLEEQSAEIAAVLSGQVDAIFPQAGAASIIKQLSANPNATSVSGPTNYGDGFWFNLADPVMKDFAVREAIAYGVDRQKIIDQIIKLNDPNATILNCLPPLFPVIDEWCSDTVQASVSGYTYDPQKAISTLEAAGYDCSKVPGSPCTKNGQPLTITEYYTAGNERRQAVGAIVQEGIKAAGIKWVVKPNDATDLFSNKLQKGDYQVIEFASGANVDPSPTSFSWLCAQIPKAPDFAGANTGRYCNKDLEPVMKQSDEALDVAQRHTLIDQIYMQIQKDLVALPLYPFINITAWRKDKIAGPIGAWNTAPYGTYWNMDQWYLASS